MDIKPYNHLRMRHHTHVLNTHNTHSLIMSLAVCLVETVWRKRMVPAIVD